MDRDDLVLVLISLRRASNVIAGGYRDKSDLMIAVCVKHPLEDHAAFILQELGGMAGAW